MLSILGVLPLSVALSSNTAFALHTVEPNQSSISDGGDEGFLRHLGIRILTSFILCILFFLLGNTQRDFSGTFLIIYGILLLFGKGMILL